ncbi:MAG: hypothetical protein HC865_03455, partial [Cyanobacteria bacterium RU_5_0]|nr:hypothetical protein [Cyanobacteria bacterium RU_5_0]
FWDVAKQPIASTTCLSRSRDGRFGRGDRLQPRVQDPLRSQLTFVVSGGKQPLPHH